RVAAVPRPGSDRDDHVRGAERPRRAARVHAVRGVRARRGPHPARRDRQQRHRPGHRQSLGAAAGAAPPQQRRRLPVVPACRSLARRGPPDRTRRMPSAPRPVSLLLVPTLVTLGVTIARLVGERMGGGAPWFSSASDGFAVVGIVWLVPVFGAWFGLRLARA